ncbi:hypothetical protein [Burkholderia lata]|nr:hypothetical protein [Burkholderia lata]
MALSGEFIVEEKIARCKSLTESRDLAWLKNHVKTAFSGMRNRRKRISRFCFETFRHFDRLRIPPAACNAGRFARSGKSRAEIFAPCRSAVSGIPAYNACGKTYINFETFRVSGPGPGNVGIAGTLAAPRFHSGWPALCVSVGTAVDEVTTGRFQKKDRRNRLRNHLRKGRPERVGEHAAPGRFTPQAFVE